MRLRFNYPIGLLLLIALILTGCAMPALPSSDAAGDAAEEATATPTVVVNVEATVAEPTPTESITTQITSTETTSSAIITESAGTVTETTTAPAAVLVPTAAARILVPTPVDGTPTISNSVASTATQDAPTTQVTLPPADAASERLSVPAGFAVRLFAAGLEKPRLMTIGPDGVLYVADQAAGQVVRLPDADGDGLADANQIVVDDLAGAHGVEWYDGWLYVASYGEVNRLRDEDGDGTFETRELVTDNIPGTGGHSSRTLHFGPDGMLYVAAGSSSNNEPERDPRRATILRFNPDGTIPADNPFAASEDERRQAVWAEGLRNSVDFLFLPDGRLWANHNGSDMLGDELPPEEIVIEVEKGGHYGWPYCYTPTVGPIAADVNEVPDERVPLDPDVLVSCEDAIPARFTDLAHYAPLGMARYTGTAFPAAYQNNLFVAYHGSWNSSDPRDCRVQMIVVEEGQPVAGQPFVTGFRADEAQQCNNAWGRPAGVVTGAEGALYVSDDQNGQIYRVVYLGE